MSNQKNTAVEYWSENDRVNADLVPLRAEMHSDLGKKHPKLKRNIFEFVLIGRACAVNASLTKEERQKLLDMPDLEAPVLGKALAYPESLTDEERSEVLRWPPDDIRRANVLKVTGGSVSLEEFLERASSDVGFLTFDRIMFVLNDYNIPPQDREWNHEKSKERADAQLLIMPELEKRVQNNSMDALQGAGIAARMGKLLAGELNEEDAVGERNKLAMYRSRYDELVWNARYGRTR